MEDLTEAVSELKSQIGGLTGKLNTSSKLIELLIEENTKLNTVIKRLNSVVTGHSIHLDELDLKVDEVSQFGRRENVVFTNL